MRWLKIGSVIFVAVAITALGIDAADTLSGSQSTLLAQLISVQKADVCPEGMVEVPMALSFSCVDVYEASASVQCPQSSPTNEFQTKENIDAPTCSAVSVENTEPWRFLSREQAVTACMRAGKRLPKSEEWYTAAVGTLDTAESCNTDTSSIVRTGTYKKCVSAVGAHDTVGNAWEWVSDDVISGTYQGRQVPSEGYISQVDAGGFATVTNISESELFYKDYFWSAADGVFAILRGGFYGSKFDAGIYAVHARTLPTAAGTAIGFRCVK